MTYCSGFTRHQPCHANFEFTMILKKRNLAVLKMTQKLYILISGFLSQASMGLIHLFTQLF